MATGLRCRFAANYTGIQTAAEMDVHRVANMSVANGVEFLI